MLISMYLFCFYFALDLSELGHSCKLSCELSARVKPTLSDVKVALIDMGMYMTVQLFSYVYKCGLQYRRLRAVARWFRVTMMDLKSACI